MRRRRHRRSMMQGPVARTHRVRHPIARSTASIRRPERTHRHAASARVHRSGLREPHHPGGHRDRSWRSRSSSASRSAGVVRAVRGDDTAEPPTNPTDRAGLSRRTRWRHDRTPAADTGACTRATLVAGDAPLPLVADPALSCGVPVCLRRPDLGERRAAGHDGPPAAPRGRDRVASGRRWPSPRCCSIATGRVWSCPLSPCSCSRRTIARPSCSRVVAVVIVIEGLVHRGRPSWMAALATRVMSGLSVILVVAVAISMTQADVWSEIVDEITAGPLPPGRGRRGGPPRHLRPPARRLPGRPRGVAGDRLRRRRLPQAPHGRAASTWSATPTPTTC